MESHNPSPKIILFDGVCNLCNSAVQFVIKRDKNRQFRFAALQSPAGQELTRVRQIDTRTLDSLILIEPNVAWYTKAEAALKIGQAFGGGWKLLGLLEWIPPVIANALYDFVARNRYRVFGKQKECMMPSPDISDRFLEQGLSFTPTAEAKS